MNKPLEGLFVVELTTYWAAPSAGEFLRCLGARVVKIETGKAGDSVRYWGRTCGMPIEANENPSFDLFNGGKEFMHMDLNDPEHERVLHNMLAKADVFLTSMRLGGLKKHNLDYDTLKEKYPRLVMAHATGYGCKVGPLSAAPGLDAVAFFAMNGLISDLRLNPDDSPICPPTGMGDLTTGMPLFGAIILAVFWNVMIYIGVEGYRSNPHELGKYLALFFGVCVFILCGFEHCVANMYYLTMGGAWSGHAVLYLLVMTVGNAAGGVIGPLARKVLSR